MIDVRNDKTVRITADNGDVLVFSTETFSIDIGVANPDPDKAWNDANLMSEELGLEQYMMSAGSGLGARDMQLEVRGYKDAMDLALRIARWLRHAGYVFEVPSQSSTQEGEDDISYWNHLSYVGFGPLLTEVIEPGDKESPNG